MANLFYDCTSLSDLTPISVWSSAPITSLSYTFYGCSSLTDLTPITHWDGNLGDLSHTFMNCTSLWDFTPLSNWDVSNVVNMTYTFCSTPISSLDAISQWDTRSIQIMNNMFYNCTHLVDIDGVANWNISNLTSISEMFSGCTNLSDISALNNWNIDGVVMSMIFKNTAISNLSPIYSWRPHFSLSLTFIDMINLTKFDFTLFTNIDYDMHVNGTFSYCRNLAICDLGYYVSQISYAYESQGSGRYYRGAFMYCEKLHTLIIRRNSICYLSDYWSSGSYPALFQRTLLRSTSGKLYVPQSLVDSYKNDIEWRAQLISYGCQVLPLEGSPYEQPGSI